MIAHKPTDEELRDFWRRVWSAWADGEPTVELRWAYGEEHAKLCRGGDASHRFPLILKRMSDRERRDALRRLQT